MLQAYRQHAAERAVLGIPPLPLDAKQTAALIELIKAPPAGEDTAFLLDLLTYRVPPGVDWRGRDGTGRPTPPGSPRPRMRSPSGCAGTRRRRP